MAIALVGSVGTFVASATTTATPAFGQATTAGNLLVAHVEGNSSTAFTVTGPTGWVAAVERNSAANNLRAAVWYKPNCGASETAPTFNASNNLRCSVAEFSGADTVSPLDQSGSNTGTTSPQTVTATATDGGTGRLIAVALGYRITAANTGTGSDSMTGSTDWGSNDAASAAYHGHGFFSLTAITGSSADADTLTATTAGTIGTVTGALASFQPVAAAASLDSSARPGAFHPGRGLQNRARFYQTARSVDTPAVAPSDPGTTIHYGYGSN